MEEDIIKGANDYYHLANKYDKKINNIVNRYETRTNQLFMDLRHREYEHKILRYKVDDLFNYKIIDYKDVEDIYHYSLYALYIYTLFVIMLVINNKY